MLAGGNTIFDGFAERIKNEIAALAPTKEIKVNLIILGYCP